VSATWGGRESFCEGGVFSGRGGKWWKLGADGGGGWMERGVFLAGVKLS